MRIAEPSPRDSALSPSHVSLHSFPLIPQHATPRRHCRKMPSQATAMVMRPIEDLIRMASGRQPDIFYFCHVSRRFCFHDFLSSRSRRDAARVSRGPPVEAVTAPQSGRYRWHAAELRSRADIFSASFSFSLISFSRQVILQPIYT